MLGASFWFSQPERYWCRISTVKTPSPFLPQGSVLGPVLFVIFVNEICNLLPPNFSLKLFADDVKLYSTVISNSDAVDLQRCLHVISAWSDAQQLKLSPSKCTVMHLSPRTANHVFTFPYAINNQVLPATDCVTDLGVMYDNHLSFVPHINKTVN